MTVSWKTWINKENSSTLDNKFSELKTSRLRLQCRDYTLSLTSSLLSLSKHPKDGYLGRRNYILNVTRLFNIRTPYCTSIMLQLGRYHHTTVPEKVIMVLITIPTHSWERKERNGGILKRRKAEEIRGNRPLPRSKNPRLQNECKIFLAIISFTYTRIKKNHFDINGFALSLPWSNSEMAYYATLLNKRVKERKPRTRTLGARDFSSAVSGFWQVFLWPTRKVFLAASAYSRRCVGLRPTSKIPAAGEKNLWYPG